jgi:hypothetical protein
MKTLLRQSRFTFRKKRPSLGWILLLLVFLGGAILFLSYGISPRAEYIAPAQGTPSPPSKTPEPPLINSNGIRDGSVTNVLQQVLTLWVGALVSGDFKAFHNALAPAWKDKDTPAKLAESYAPISSYKEILASFPGRGKLVLLESGPYVPPETGSPSPVGLRDNMGPESPWLVRGEWRTGRTTLNFILVLDKDAQAWKPLGLRVEVYDSGNSNAL